MTSSGQDHVFLRRVAYFFPDPRPCECGRVFVCQMYLDCNRPPRVSNIVKGSRADIDCAAFALAVPPLAILGVVLLPPLGPVEFCVIGLYLDPVRRRITLIYGRPQRLTVSANGSAESTRSLIPTAQDADD